MSKLSETPFIKVCEIEDKKWSIMFFNGVSIPWHYAVIMINRQINIYTVRTSWDKVKFFIEKWCSVSTEHGFKSEFKTVNLNSAKIIDNIHNIEPSKKNHHYLIYNIEKLEKQYEEEWKNPHKL
jgi:hypothetical protein